MHPLLLGAALFTAQAPPTNNTSDVFELPPVEPVTTPQDEKPMRLAITKLKAAGMSEEYVEGVTETLATSISETGVFDTISPRQISALLAYEKRKEIMGSCLEEDCFVQIAKAVKADQLVGGSVAKIGDKLILNLVLIDVKEGRALKRVNREATSPSGLISETRQAVVVLLQPLLRARQGYLKVTANVPDAGVIIDDIRRSEGVNQVIGLAAGPHLLKVHREGFYATTANVFIKPGRVFVEDVKLIPARETIENYESTASLMRYGAYGTAAVAIGSAIASGFFYAQATDDKNMVDAYTSALDSERAIGGDAARRDAIAAQDSFNTNQALYLGFLGTAVLSGGVSLVLFLIGDDPDKYEEFRSLR